MATKPSNRSGSDVQGAFGDQDKQDTRHQEQTKYDDDSTMNKDLITHKKAEYTSEKQSSMDKDNQIDRKQD
ncbi:MAG TPA: hypothetical protein VH186_00540 [Chloroflexia bacterium]|nr:hypothetical protein [Chloroflexia bacterium]